MMDGKYHCEFDVKINGISAGKRRAAVNVEVPLGTHSYKTLADLFGAAELNCRLIANKGDAPGEQTTLANVIEEVDIEFEALVGGKLHHDVRTGTIAFQMSIPRAAYLETPLRFSDYGAAKLYVSRTGTAEVKRGRPRKDDMEGDDDLVEDEA